MSRISNISSGKIPDIFIRNSNPVSKNTGSSESQCGEIGQALQSNKENIERIQNAAAQAQREGRVKDLMEIATPVYDKYEPSSTPNPDYEGKTIVNNSDPSGITIKHWDKNDIRFLESAGVHEARAKAGVATHSFFHREVDFLLDAAKKYAVLEENEEFKYRDIEDLNFVRDTLDFFTNGDYKQGDVNAVRKQMNGVVRELAQQLKNGESPDLSKLQSTLTIGGAEVTMSQLLDFQKVGKELKESFTNITVGSLSQHNLEGFAEMGIAKAIGNHYGSDKGEIGKLFSAGIDRLYEKGVAYANNTFYDSPFLEKRRSSEKEALEVGKKTADLFAGMDTGSKESLSKDFAARLAEVRSTVESYCAKYGIPSSHVGLAGATAGMTNYFENWMNRV